MKIFNYSQDEIGAVFDKDYKSLHQDKGSWINGYNRALQDLYRIQQEEDNIMLENIEAGEAVKNLTQSALHLKNAFYMIEQITGASTKCVGCGRLIQKEGSFQAPDGYYCFECSEGMKNYNEDEHER